MAGINRFSSATALAALSIWIPANAQQANEQAENIDTVIVTGVREALVKGLENKRNATQVLESIVAEDIGKLPDNNVIEALQRVTGVQITNRGGGEADGISIRGLPDAATTWNGRSLFTSNGRALQLQDVPATLVNRIDVFKTRSADQLETGLAGQIDVHTRRPFDAEGLQASFNARYTFQEQRDSRDPQVSALLSNTWEMGDDGKFGALVNVSYTKVRWRDQNMTAGAMVPFAPGTGIPGYGAAADNCPNTPPDQTNWTPLERLGTVADCRGTPLNQPSPAIWSPGTDPGLSWSPTATLPVAGNNVPYLLARDALIAVDAQGNRERPAANLALQWAPNDNSEYTFEAFYQGYDETIFNNLFFTFVDAWWGLGASPATSYTLFPDTNVIKTRRIGLPDGFQSGDAIQQFTDSYAYALNGKWQVGEKLTLVGDVSFQESTFVTNFIAMRLNAPRFTVPFVDVDFNAGGGIPSFHFNDDAHLLDPNFWIAAELFQNKGKSSGDAKTIQLDGDYAVAGDTEDSWFKKLKFGVRYDSRTATQASPRPVAPAFRGGTFAAFDPKWFHVNDGFMDGNADMPSTWLVPNGWYMAEHRDDLRAIYGVDQADPRLIRAFDVEEKTSAAYAQADMKFGDKFDAQVGVRFVKVDTDMVFTNVISEIASDADSSVDDILPAVTLRYAVTPDFTLRFNYGETLRRPDFGDLNPNFNLTQDLSNVGYGSGTGGNPELEATKSKNFDLTAEWYFAKDSAIYGTLFKRDIEGLVVRIGRRQTILGTGLNTDSFVITQPLNASNGELKGIELGFLWFPELPGVFNGLGFNGSLTKLDSEQNIPLTNPAGEIVGQENTDFFGVSDMSYNFTLAYDRGSFNGRLSYVWREEFLGRNENRLFANPIGIWRRPETSLDLQLNYNVNDKVAVSFDAVNLTEDLQQEYYRFADAGDPGISNFSNVLLSRSFSLGVRWKY